MGMEFWVAFDVAENRSSEDKRRIAETAVGTLRFLYGYESEGAPTIDNIKGRVQSVLLLKE